MKLGKFDEGARRQKGEPRSAVPQSMFARLQQVATVWCSIIRYDITRDGSASRWFVVGYDIQNLTAEVAARLTATTIPCWGLLKQQMLPYRHGFLRFAGMVVY